MKARELLMNRNIAVVLIVYSFFALVLLLNFLAGDGAVSDGAQAPEFVLQDVFGGESVEYADYRGRPVLMYFFATW
jgi:hypothetical protein